MRKIHWKHKSFRTDPTALIGKIPFQFARYADVSRSCSLLPVWNVLRSENNIMQISEKDFKHMQTFADLTACLDTFTEVCLYCLWFTVGYSGTNCNFKMFSSNQLSLFFGPYENCLAKTTGTRKRFKYGNWLHRYVFSRQSKYSKSG